MQRKELWLGPSGQEQYFVDIMKRLLAHRWLVLPLLPTSSPAWACGCHLRNIIYLHQQKNCCRPDRPPCIMYWRSAAAARLALPLLHKSSLNQWILCCAISQIDINKNLLPTWQTSLYLVLTFSGQEQGLMAVSKHLNKSILPREYRLSITLYRVTHFVWDYILFTLIWNSTMSSTCPSNSAWLATYKTESCRHHNIQGKVE